MKNIITKDQANWLAIHEFLSQRERFWQATWFILDFVTYIYTELAPIAQKIFVLFVRI